MGSDCEFIDPVFARTDKWGCSMKLSADEDILAIGDDFMIQREINCPYMLSTRSMTGLVLENPSMVRVKMITKAVQ